MIFLRGHKALFVSVSTVLSSINFFNYRNDCTFVRSKSRKGTAFERIMQKIAQFITRFIGFFYTPFSQFVPRQVFTYAVCGGVNILLDWVLYFLIYNFVVGHALVYISLFGIQFCLTPHIASLCIVFPITLLTGFWLNKYVTFTQSSLRGWSQLMRYVSVVFVNLFLNYFGLKLLVEIYHWYPTPAKMFITVITVLFSFFSQKYFSFRK